MSICCNCFCAGLGLIIIGIAMIIYFLNKYIAIKRKKSAEKELKFAEKILDKILRGNRKVNDLYIKVECKKKQLNNSIVFQFLEEHAEKEIERGFGGGDFYVIKKNSVHFVYFGCWSGEENRNKRIRDSGIIAAIVGAIVSFILQFVINIINKL